MPIRTVPGTDLTYYLLSHDENGHERDESDGSRLSAAILQAVADPGQPVTDVFLASHGWKGDVAGAIEQYDRWIDAMGSMSADRADARARVPGFRSLVVGLHWPSLPWGDERTGGRGLLSGNAAGAEETAPSPAMIEAYAARIADSPVARSAIALIVEAASTASGSSQLTPPLQAAYAALFRESGLSPGAVAGAPGADQDGFDPQLIIDEAAATGVPVVPGPGVLAEGGRHRLRDLLLMPLRQLSFWKMKARALTFGESGAHDLLIALQSAASGTRFHLMGHSFGGIVVSGAVAGPAGGRPLPRPVDSLFLVQGALSLWSMAANVPYAPGTAGYFARIVGDGLVKGPIVTTRSSHDKAVGRFYPLGAEIKKQFLLAPQPFPKYGGVGAFGLQGLRSAARDQRMQGETFGYDFHGRTVYNLEASTVIAKEDGASGAHSDIAHPAVAHVQWQVALAGHPPRSTVKPRTAGSMRGGPG